LRTDRRRFKRYRLELPLKFRLYLPSSPDVSSPFHSAQLYDLSQSGMRMLTNIVQSGSLHILHPETTAAEQCHLEIEVPDDERTLVMIGKVVWYDRNTEEHPYSFRVGIAFVDVGSENLQRLQSLIRRQTVTASPSEEPSPDSSK